VRVQPKPQGCPKKRRQRVSTKKPAYSKILDGSTEVSAKTFKIWYQDPSDIVGGSLLRKVCGSITLYPSNLTACVSVALFKLIKLPKRNRSFL
jgi:hypothetical protein